MIVNDEVKPITLGEYSTLYKKIRREFKPIDDILTRRYDYNGHKIHIQILPYTPCNSDNPIVKYRIIYPQVYVTEPSFYNGIIDLPFWMRVKNEIENTINNNFYK